jgi:hypothetical protein
MTVKTIANSKNRSFKPHLKIFFPIITNCYGMQQKIKRTADRPIMSRYSACLATLRVEILTFTQPR